MIYRRQVADNEVRRRSLATIYFDKGYGQVGGPKPMTARAFRDQNSRRRDIGAILGDSLTSTGKQEPRPASDSSRPPTGTRVVVTGKDGKARVSFKAPSALSEYRITARGITGADTLAGQNDGDR